MGCDFSVWDIMTNPRRRKWVYFFDSWEPDWKTIEDYIKDWRNVGAVFFSSSQTVDHFKERFDFPVIWCPQAGDAKEFENYIPLEERPNQIINIGRPNCRLNDFFSSFAERKKFRYFSQKSNLDIIFYHRVDFLNALLTSKIIIVHPRNIDSPEVTGRVSLLTARYFEAYQAGAIVCGFKPNSGEFEKVFGEYPFVEFSNERQFEEQLLEQLRHPGVWLEARNKALMEQCWDERVKMINSHISHIAFEHDFI